MCTELIYYMCGVNETEVLVYTNGPNCIFPHPKEGAGFRYRSIECQSKDFNSKVSYTFIV